MTSAATDSPQWSPTLTGREGIWPPNVPAMVELPQWSPTLTGREGTKSKIASVSVSAPQWSPTLTGREGRALHRAVDPEGMAAMEPDPEGPGGADAVNSALTFEPPPQWSPTLTGREGGRYEPQGHQEPTGRNGARP